MPGFIVGYLTIANYSSCVVHVLNMVAAYYEREFAKLHPESARINENLTRIKKRLIKCYKPYFYKVFFNFISFSNSSNLFLDSSSKALLLMAESFDI